MTNKLKTLKDIKELANLNIIGDTIPVRLIGEDELKSVVVKWVKEDLKYLNEIEIDKFPAEMILNSWIKRFNLTEGDLK